jgi:hypothetical protein
LKRPPGGRRRDLGHNLRKLKTLTPASAMPPNKKAKKAGGGAKDASTAEIDSKLAAVDLLVNEMRSQLEAACVAARRALLCFL